jgi:hypothetical protein
MPYIPVEVDMFRKSILPPSSDRKRLKYDVKFWLSVVVNIFSVRE